MVLPNLSGGAGGSGLPDRDDMVVKALSWALSELSKSDKGEVRQFMTDFESLLSGRVKREVTYKPETGRKTDILTFKKYL